MAFLSFMLSKDSGIGVTEVPLIQKKQLAKKSLEFNLSNSIFRDLFKETLLKMNLLSERSNRSNPIEEMEEKLLLSDDLSLRKKPLENGGALDQTIEKNGRRTRNLRKKGLEEKELFQTKKIRKGGRK